MVKYDKIERPSVLYSQPGNPVVVKIKAGGIGPFAGGYGFGVRSTYLVISFVLILPGK
jgi:hypothetical protein